MPAKKFINEHGRFFDLYLQLAGRISLFLYCDCNRANRLNLLQFASKTFIYVARNSYQRMNVCIVINLCAVYVHRKNAQKFGQNLILVRLIFPLIIKRVIRFVQQRRLQTQSFITSF